MHNLHAYATPGFDEIEPAVEQSPDYAAVLPRPGTLPDTNANILYTPSWGMQ